MPDLSQLIPLAFISPSRPSQGKPRPLFDVTTSRNEGFMRQSGNASQRDPATCLRGGREKRACFFSNASSSPHSSFPHMIFSVHFIPKARTVFPTTSQQLKCLTLRCVIQGCLRPGRRKSKAFLRRAKVWGDMKFQIAQRTMNALAADSFFSLELFDSRREIRRLYPPRWTFS